MAGVRVDPEEVSEVMQASEYRVMTLFGTCTVVAMRMPCGYVLVESSACVNPEDYDEETGADICCERIENKVWALLGYEHIKATSPDEMGAGDDME